MRSPDQVQKRRRPELALDGLVSSARSSLHLSLQVRKETLRKILALLGAKAVQLAQAGSRVANVTQLKFNNSCALEVFDHRRLAACCHKPPAVDTSVAELAAGKLEPCQQVKPQGNPGSALQVLVQEEAVSQ